VRAGEYSAGLQRGVAALGQIQSRDAPHEPPRRRHVGTPGYPRQGKVIDATFRPALRLSALDLAPLDTAVPSARLHARYVVREWGMASLAADCELVVAELVTNGIQAGRRLPGTTASPPVRLRITGRPLDVQVEVWDGGDDMPEPGRDRPGEPGGWGLILVDALAARWGTYHTAGGGKCVWAMLNAGNPEG
jgi:anti-sigma regulatory factor (Ser/Thr protein kinase)